MIAREDKVVPPLRWVVSASSAVRIEKGCDGQLQLQGVAMSCGNHLDLCHAIATVKL